MGWRFRKSIRVGKLGRINIGKRGVGVSVGVPGARVGVGSRGAYSSVGVPGTGLYSVNYAQSGGGKSQGSQPSTPPGGASRGSMPPEMRRGCAIVALVVLVAGTVITALQPNSEPAEQRQRTEAVSQAGTATPDPEPVPTDVKPAATLTAGQTYQVAEDTYLLNAMSKLDVVKENSTVIPAGGYFQCVGKADATGGNWYSVQAWDAAGGVYRGYVDADDVKLATAADTGGRQSIFGDRPSQGASVQTGSTFGAGRPQVAPSPTLSAASDTVYIAPQSGLKYHGRSNCAGLRNAQSVVAVSRTEAAGSGYTPCGICKPR